MDYLQTIPVVTQPMSSESPAISSTSLNSSLQTSTQPNTGKVLKVILGYVNVIIIMIPLIHLAVAKVPLCTRNKF